jgi:tetratricopeptide (TPR) repeat protein
LTAPAQAAVLNWSAFALRALGRLDEATQPMEAGYRMRIAQEDWKNAAMDAGNLSQLWSSLGVVAEAVRWGERAVDHADNSGAAFLKMVMRTTLAEARYQAGDLERARELFAAAEALQKERQPQYPLLYSLRGYGYHDLLLSQGQYREVRRRVEQTLAWAQQFGDLLSQALDQLALARAVHGAWLDEDGAEDAAAVEAHMDRAVAALRKAGRQDHLPRGLLARAAFLRDAGRLQAAARDLAEAREIAERGGMELHLVDVLLAEARLAKAEGHPDTAATRIEAARALIEETGYKRRLPDLN